MTMDIALPEQISLRLRPAGYPSRAVAYAIDFFLRWVIITTIVLITLLLLIIGVHLLGGELEFWSAFGRLVSLLTEPATGMAARAFYAGLILLMFTVEWGYPVYFEVWREGVTPGKKGLGLRVVDEEGLPVTFRASALRALFRMVDILPALGLIGFVSMALTNRSQRLGDLVAGTLVVFDEPMVHRIANSAGRDVVIPFSHYRILEEYLARRDEFAPAAHEEVRKLLGEALLQVLPPELLSPQPGEAWFDEVYRRVVPAAEDALHGSD